MSRGVNPLYWCDTFISKELYMITVHHLENSRSHRVLWLLEELAVPYQIKRYQRENTMLAPDELKKVHPLGKSPVITDGNRVIAESGAILEYLQMKYDSEQQLTLSNEDEQIQGRDRGDLVILYDKGCTFIREFYDPAVDHVLNPYDARCANWDLWAECPRLSDLKTVASTLIPMGASDDPFWQGSARTIFAEGTEKLRDAPDRSYNRLLRTLLSINLDQLRKVLAARPPRCWWRERLKKPLSLSAVC